MSSLISAHASPTITVGDVSLTAILDTDLAFGVPIDEVFPGVDEDGWNDARRRYPGAFNPEGGWRYTVTCYLVRANDRLVLVDTGCGPATLAFPDFIGAPDGSLHARLAGLDVGANEIDTVVITHIHPDHVGGVLAPDAKGASPAPAFPAARYLVPALDWASWKTPEVQEGFPVPYVGDTIGPLIELEMVDLFEGEHRVTDELLLRPTPGHTPGSASLEIASNDERAILVGDVWLHPAQITEPDLGCAFDMDPEASRTSRATLAGEIAERSMTMGACHLPEPFGQIVRLDGRHHWMASTRWSDVG